MGLTLQASRLGGQAKRSVISPLQLGLDFLNGGEAAFETVWEPLHHLGLPFGPPLQGAFRCLSAYSTTIRFLDLHRSRPIAGLSSRCFSSSSTADK